MRIERKKAASKQSEEKIVSKKMKRSKSDFLCIFLRTLCFMCCDTASMRGQMKGANELLARPFSIALALKTLYQEVSRFYPIFI